MHQFQISILRSSKFVLVFSFVLFLQFITSRIFCWVSEATKLFPVSYNFNVFFNIPKVLVVRCYKLYLYFQNFYWQVQRKIENMVNNAQIFQYSLKFKATLIFAVNILSFSLFFRSASPKFSNYPNFIYFCFFCFVCIIITSYIK